MSVPQIDYEKRLDARIGKAVRERRESVGMTQAALAAAIGVTFQQVQKYEQGRNRVATSKLVRMADAMKCDASELLGERGGHTPGRGLWALARGRIRLRLIRAGRALGLRPAPADTQIGGRARNFCEEARRFGTGRRRRKKRPPAPGRPLSSRSPPIRNLAEKARPSHQPPHWRSLTMGINIVLSSSLVRSAARCRPLSGPGGRPVKEAWQRRGVAGAV
ncbi:MAG: hypothetical protein B7Y99_12330 [Caulobacterales bacterium 32-69-10]|nr:MAG: hypothetical protein B7Y99_12330 [Caulobacterales bacterium 32-69-10]